MKIKWRTNFFVYPLIRNSGAGESWWPVWIPSQHGGGGVTSALGCQWYILWEGDLVSEKAWRNWLVNANVTAEQCSQKSEGCKFIVKKRCKFNWFNPSLPATSNNIWNNWNRPVELKTKVKRMFAKIAQSWKRFLLLGPSSGLKRLLVLSHLRH